MLIELGVWVFSIIGAFGPAEEVRNSPEDMNMGFAYEGYHFLLGQEERDDIKVFQEARRTWASPVAGGGMMSKGDQDDRDGKKRGLYNVTRQENELGTKPCRSI